MTTPAGLRRLAVARGDEPADLALKGGRVLSVFTGEVRLLSELPFEEVASAAARLEEAARSDLGATYPAPLMAMSFLVLTVIPELRITDRGLVDVTRLQRVPLSA